MEYRNPDERYWYRRHPHLALGLFSLFGILLLLLIVEISFRLAGYIPGAIILEEAPVRLEKNLKFYPDYIADDRGILKISPQSAQEISQWIQSDSNYLAVVDSMEYSKWQVISAFSDICRNRLPDGEFSQRVTELKRKDPELLSTLESLILEYANNPINQEGFRSIPFRKVSSGKPSVLLVGDSFTWGQKAEPVTHSFADRLLARGYPVYNTGIISTGPDQYLAVCQKYVPDLQPELVVLNFFLGDDHMYHNRNAVPYRKSSYQTNIGWISAYFYSQHLEEYEWRQFFATGKFPIPEKWCGHLPKIILKTCIGSRIVWNLGSSGLYGGFSQEPLTLPYLETIDQVCRESGSKLIISLIPTDPEGHFSEKYSSTLEAQKDYFGDLKFHYPEGFLHSDYFPGDDHFNNKGMRKYADWLEYLIIQNTQ